MKNQEKIKNLYKKRVKRLLDLNEAYFERDDPLVSDQEFDSFKKDLSSLAVKYPFLKMHQ